MNALARPTIVVLCCGAVVGCSANGANTVSPSESSAPPATSAAPSSSASSTPGGARYVLVDKSRVDIADLVAPLTAVSGSIVSEGTTGNAVTWTAIGLDKRGQTAWTLSLQISPQNRVVSGGLAAQGRTWKVLPNTGQLHVDATDSGLMVTTVRAITMNAADTPTVNTPMVVSLVGRPTPGAL